MPQTHHALPQNALECSIVMLLVRSFAIIVRLIDSSTYIEAFNVYHRMASLDENVPKELVAGVDVEVSCFTLESIFKSVILPGS